MTKISKPPFKANPKGRETAAMVQSNVTRRAALGGFVGVAAAPYVSAAPLAGEQVDNNVYVQRVFIDLPLADAEAATSEGQFFKLIDSSSELVAVRYRTGDGSDLVCEEVTVGALSSPEGGRMVGLWNGSNVGQALRYYTPEMGGAVGDGNPANAGADRAGWEWLEGNAPAEATIHAYGQYCIGGETALELSKPWTIDFGTSGGFRNVRSVPGVAVQWTGATGSEVSVSANVAKGARSVTVSDANGIAAGDIVRLASDIVLTDSRPALIYEREWSRVLSVAGNVLNLAFPTEHAYAVADNAKVLPAAPIRGLRLRGPRAINAEDGEGQMAIGIRFFDDLRIEGAYAEGGEKGIYARDGINGVMTDAYGKGVNKGLGYAFQFQSVRFATFLRPGGEDCRHIVEFNENTIHSAVIDPQMGVNGSAGVISWHAGSLHCKLTGGVVGGDVYLRGSINTVRDVVIEAGATLYFGEVEIDAPATRMTSCVDGEVAGCTFRGDGGVIGKVALRHPPRNFKVHDNTVDIGTAGSNGDFVNVGEVGYGLELERNIFKSCRYILTLRRANYSPLNVGPFGDANFANIKSRWNRGVAIRHIHAPFGSLLNSGLLCDGLELRGNELTLSYHPIAINSNPVWIRNLRVFDNETTYSGSGSDPVRILDDMQAGTSISADWSGLQSHNNTGTYSDNMGVEVAGGEGVARYTPAIGTRTTDTNNSPRLLCIPPSGYSATYAGIVVSDGLLTGVNFTIRDSNGDLAADGQTVRFVRLDN